MTTQALFSRASLADAMALACKIAPKRHVIHILANVLMREHDGAAMIEATDLDLTARITLADAVADAGFAATVPAHSLRDAVKIPASDRKRLAGAEVTIAAGDTGATVLASGARASLPTLDVADWPEMKIEGEIRADFTIPRAAMLAALESVHHAISTEATRYYLNGIFMHAHRDADGANALRFVACDGHRLAVRTIGAGAIVGAWEDMPAIIIPTGTVNFMVATLKRKSAPDDVRVIVNSVKARLISGNVDVVTKLIQGTFPDYQRVIPSGNDKRLTIGRAALASAVKSVSHVFTKNSCTVRLRLEPADVLRIDAKNDDTGSADADAPCVYDGAPLAIGFNGRYLLEILDSFGSDEVTLEFADGGTPTVISGGCGTAGDAFGVLMPMRF